MHILFGCFYKEGTSSAVNHLNDLPCCIINTAVSNVLIELIDFLEHAEAALTAATFTILCHINLPCVGFPFTIMYNSGLGKCDWQTLFWESKDVV